MRSSGLYWRSRPESPEVADGIEEMGVLESLEGVSERWESFCSAAPDISDVCLEHAE